MAGEGLRPHLILCNGAPRPSRAGQWHDAPTLTLNTHPMGNMAIRIRQRDVRIHGTLNPRAVDLLEIIACICVADEATADAERHLRHFRFEIAVREPGFWRRAQIVAGLQSVAQSLCDDTFEFSFTRHPTPPLFGRYLDCAVAPHGAASVERVLAFMGNIDSLAGAFEEVFSFNRRIVLVGHRPSAHLLPRLKSLFEEFRKRAGAHAPQLKPAGVGIMVKKKSWSRGCRPVPHTHSLLITTLSAVVAHLLGLSAVYVYENGITSLNLPLAGGNIGAPASRTTHPETLSGLSTIFTAVFEQPFSVQNEYLWLTKREVVERLSQYRHASLISQAVSCIQPERTTEHQPHCGRCSRCIARRLAVLGAGMERYDPATLYQHDVLTGPRQVFAEQNTAEWSVAQAHQIGTLDSAETFAQVYQRELTCVTAYMSESVEVQHELLYDLHFRHAQQFNETIVDAMRRHLFDYYTRRLEPTSVLGKAFAIGAKQDGERQTSSPQVEVPRKVEGSNDTRFTPTVNERLVLEILAGAKSPMTHVAIETDTKPRGHHIGLRTLRRLLRSLEERGWVYYPRGRRHGLWLTDAGRQLLELGFGASA